MTDLGKNTVKKIALQRVKGKYTVDSRRARDRRFSVARECSSLGGTK